MNKLVNNPFSFVDFVIDREDCEPSWPHDVSSLDHFKTIAFDRTLMRGAIDIGWFSVSDPARPWVKESFGPRLDSWMVVVPACYRSAVVALVGPVFDRTLKNNIYRGDRGPQLDMFIDELRRAIWNNVAPVSP